MSYTTRMVTDATCSVHVCRSASNALSHIYIVIFIFMLIVASTKAKQIKDSFGRFQRALSVIMNEKAKKD